MSEPAALVVESLLAESADVVTLAQYVSDEMASIIADEQCPSSIARDVLRVKAAMDAVVTAFGG